MAQFLSKTLPIVNLDAHGLLSTTIIHKLLDPLARGYPRIIMSTWKIGDLVQLKSGGPTMTVTNVREAPGEAPRVTCTRYDGDKCIEQNYHPDTLAKAQFGFDNASVFGSGHSKAPPTVGPL
jgi:uncharacterized protein YodC (DUF2158 family)